MSGKLLMFTKLSLKSFIYDIIETFCFSQKEIVNLKQEIFDREGGNYSTALKFIFISDPTVIYQKISLGT